jgi:hypothetical protein
MEKMLQIQVKKSFATWSVLENEIFSFFGKSLVTNQTGYAISSMAIRRAQLREKAYFDQLILKEFL